MKRALWIFGYGSLVWRPSFPYAKRRPAAVEGWARRFWQGSTDHRGVPGAPGRVVTLVRDSGSTCWGMAYKVAHRDLGEVLSVLDHREKGGYERVDVALHVQGENPDCESAPALMYLATPANPNYLGPAPIDDIARQVRRSSGPSGPNREYVIRLAEALREMGARDEHVFSIEERVLDPCAAGRR